jgi:hypothetical protein
VHNAVDSHELLFMIGVVGPGLTARRILEAPVVERRRVSSAATEGDAMPKRRRPLWSVVAMLSGLALLLTACPEEVAVEPEPDPDAEDPEPDEPDEVDEPEEEPVGDEVTLTLGHGFPEAHLIHVNVLEPFAEEVHNATGGAVEIDIIPG